MTEASTSQSNKETPPSETYGGVSFVTAKFCPPGICSRILIGGILGMVATIAVVFVVSSASFIKYYSYARMNHNVALHSLNMTLHLFITFHCLTGMLGLFIYHKLLIRFFTLICQVGLLLFLIYVLSIDVAWFTGFTKNQISTDFERFFRRSVVSDSGQLNEAIDMIQESYGCCGVNNQFDYNQYNLTLPDSCEFNSDGCANKMNMSEEMSRGFVTIEFIMWLMLYLLLYFGLSFSQDRSIKSRRQRLS